MWLLLPSYECCESVIDQAAEELTKYWGGSFLQRKTKLTTKQEQVDAKSFILVDAASRTDFIGHGEIKMSAYTSSDALFSSILIAFAKRKTGLGKILMIALERECVRMGFGYAYLWTSDAEPFYVKNHYIECETNGGSFNSALAKLSEEGVNLLESFLFAKRISSSTKATTSAVKPKWLRKRLIDEFPLLWIDLETLQSSIEKELRITTAEAGLPVSLKCDFYPQALPWSRQVGPSCGIQALRIAFEMIMIRSKDSEAAEEVVEDATKNSFLQRARERGLTADGEIFDIENLSILANSCDEIRGRVLNFQEMSIDDIKTSLIRGDFLVVPYDRDDVGCQPCKKDGNKAHYSLIFSFAETESKSNSEEESFFLFTTHGLSARFVIASLREFKESNAQCKPVVMRRKEWVVGEEGAQLHNRILLISSSPTDAL